MTVTAALFVTEGFSLGGFRLLTAVTPAPHITDGSRPASEGTLGRTHGRLRSCRNLGHAGPPLRGGLGALVRCRLFLSSCSAAALSHLSGAWRTALSVWGRAQRPRWEALGNIRESGEFYPPG